MATTAHASGNRYANMMGGGLHYRRVKHATSTKEPKLSPPPQPQQPTHFPDIHQRSKPNNNKPASTKPKPQPSKCDASTQTSFLPSINEQSETSSDMMFKLVTLQTENLGLQEQQVDRLTTELDALRKEFSQLKSQLKNRTCLAASQCVYSTRHKNN